MLYIELEGGDYFLEVFIFDFGVSDFVDGGAAFYQQRFAGSDINHVAEKLHGVFRQNVEDFAQPNRKFLVVNIVDVQFNAEEFHDSDNIIQRFFGERGAGFDEGIKAFFDFGVVDSVDDGDFDGLGVSGQFERVVRNVNERAVENAEALKAVG